MFRRSGPPNRSSKDLTATPGYESVDLHGAQIAADLSNRWPFGDGEVGIFRAHDALERLRDSIHTMWELPRAEIPGPNAVRWPGPWNCGKSDES